MIVQAQRSDDLPVAMADLLRLSIAPGQIEELKSVIQKRHVFTQLLDHFCGKLSEMVYEEIKRATPLLSGVVLSAAGNVDILAQKPVDKWVHKPRSTLASGCYGVEWPVLVLYFLHLNQQMIETPSMVLLESYIGVERTMSRREWDEVAIAAEKPSDCGQEVNCNTGINVGRMGYLE
ncbi:hypothetical protein FRC12_008063 [Ceratobasidium sp. 428]|nr:hypothetical protein FRC12_008063 [Ceratobasidium sp. 428]